MAGEPASPGQTAAEQRLPQPAKGQTETHRAEQSASRSGLLSLVAALWPSCTFAMSIKPAQAWEAAGVGDGAGRHADKIAQQWCREGSVCWGLCAAGPGTMLVVFSAAL